MNDKIYLISDIHGRDFYKPILNIKDKPVIFLGDYLDPYKYEDITDEHAIENFEEILDFAKSNDNVTLLVGNHDESFLWSFMGFERTDSKYYKDLHRLYRDNVKLFKPCLKKYGVLFTHAGVSKGWIDTMNREFEQKEASFRLTQDNIDTYIVNEFEKELKFETAVDHMWDHYLRSQIFCIGYSRWGDAPYGGPFWSDFNDEYWDPEGWNLIQIFSHTQRAITGTLGINGNGYCIDSRAIFEYDIKNEIVFKADFL